jgi:hypothetical protein
VIIEEEEVEEEEEEDRDDGIGTMVLKRKHVTAGCLKNISLGTGGPCCWDKLACA